MFPKKKKKYGGESILKDISWRPYLNTYAPSNTFPIPLLSYIHDKESRLVVVVIEGDY